MALSVEQMRKNARENLLESAATLLFQTQRDYIKVRRSLDHGEPLSHMALADFFLRLSEGWRKIDNEYSRALDEAKKQECPDWYPSHPDDGVRQMQMYRENGLYGNDADLIFDTIQVKGGGRIG